MFPEFLNFEILFLSTYDIGLDLSSRPNLYMDQYLISQLFQLVQDPDHSPKSARPTL
jgi:hypothetical protein